MSIKTLRNKRGVTLVELLVVISILTIVIGLIYGIFISQMRSKFWQDQVLTMQQEMRTGMDMLVNELRIANEITRNIGSYTYNGSISFANVLFTADVDADDYLDWVLYTYNGTDKQLLRKSGNIGASAPLNDPNDTGNPLQVIADGITNVTLIYYDASDSPMNYNVQTGAITSLDQNTLGDIRRIKVSITSETKKVNPETGNKLNRTLETSVKLRGEKTWKVSGAGCGILEMSIDKIDIAFCDNEIANITVKIWDLENHRVGYDYKVGETYPYANNSKVKVFPKGGEPLTFSPTDIINVSTTTGSTMINSSDIKTAGTAIEILGSWNPPSPCTYDILTSRTIIVKAGKPWKIAKMDATSTSLKGCSTGCPDQTSTIKAQVTDKCGNPMNGFGLKFDITNAGSFSDSSLLTSTILNTDSSGYTTVIYYAPDTFTSGTNPARITVSDPVDEDSLKDLNSGEASDKSKSLTITLSPCDAKYLIENSSPFAIATTECPNKSFGLNFRVTDACGNPREGELGNLKAVLSRNKAGESVSLTNPDLYTVIYNTPSGCGDGNVDPTITLSHDPAISNTLSAVVSLDQCPMPGLDVSISDPVPAEVVPCYQAPATIKAVLRDSDNCSPWPVKAEFTFENINKTKGESSPDIGGFSISNSPSTTTSTLTVTETDGTAQVYFFGKNDTNKASVGDELKVRAKAKIIYDPEAGAYGREYKDGPDGTYYGDLVHNLLDVIPPTVEAKFMDSTYTTSQSSFFVNCSAGGTAYFEIRDCDSGNPISVLLNSVDINGTQRDSEKISIDEKSPAGSRVFQSSLPVSITTGAGINNGTLLIKNGDWIHVKYTDASDSSIKTASVRAGGFSDNLQASNVFSNGWVNTASHASPNWHQGDSFGSQWLVYNDGTDFDNGATNRGVLNSPVFKLSRASGNYLTFLSSLETEYSFGFDILNSNSSDRRTIHIKRVEDGVSVRLDPDASLAEDSNSKTRNLLHPENIAIDLNTKLDSTWEGKDVQVAFIFNTGSADSNQYKGWFVDNVFIGCAGDITGPAAPVINGTTLTSGKVQIAWSNVTDAAYYALYIDSPDPNVVKSTYDGTLTTNSCTESGKDNCYQYTPPSSLSGTYDFYMMALDSSLNPGSFSAKYTDTSELVLTAQMTCYEKVASGAEGKNKIMVKGKVKNLDGTLISDAKVNFQAKGDSSLATDTWSLITNASGAYCGSNEYPDDGTNPTPFSNTDKLIETSFQATKADYTSSSPQPFVNEQACTCP
ncbi:MAG: prepilin-type N-terminal cleavage/methylation domain-containing protein [Nitrospirae bacterium]|nr:prepilin-type N-terminal cleavage/methylation domain-containing protein [Nitrospirota bacterium]